MSAIPAISNMQTEAVTQAAMVANNQTTQEQLSNQVETTRQKAAVSLANARSEIANMVRM